MTDNIHITILGSGTCVPSLRRSSCAFLLEVADQKLLFDLGVGTIHRLLARGVALCEITHIFLSHFHPDHSAELVPFLFSSKYGGFPERGPLTLIAGTGLQQFYRGLQAVYGKWIEWAPELLHFYEVIPDSGLLPVFDGFTLAAKPVQHNPESLAFRITSRRGKSVVYSGDTDEDPGLIEIADQTDLFICECAFPDELKVPGHLTPARAGDIASRAGVKQLVLTHFYPVCDQTDIRRQCRTTYKGPLILATDLLELVI